MDLEESSSITAVGDPVLHRILDEHGDAKYELPPLRMERGWLDRLKEKALEYWDSFKEFIGDLFPELDTPNIPIDLLKVFEVLAWMVIGILIITVGLYLGRLVYLYLTKGKRHSAVPVLGTESKVVDLLKELQEAESRGNFSRALRLRWRQALSSLGSVHSTTPAELFSRDVRYGVATSILTKMYHGMFGIPQPIEAEYRELTAEITKLKDRQ